MSRQLDGNLGNLATARGIRLRCLDRARPDGDHLQAVPVELNFGRGFTGVNRASSGYLAAIETHLDAVGSQGGIEHGGQARCKIPALRRVRSKYHVGGELLDELAKRLSK